MPTIETSRACGGVLVVIATFGLVVYLLFCYIIYTRAKFKNKSYFMIAGCLGIADCMCLVLMIGYAAPKLISNRPISDNLFVGGILNVGWFSGLPLILVLAGDRYFCICDKDNYTRLYSKKASIIYCIICWVFGTFYSLPSFFPCCPLLFDKQLMSWGWSVDQKGAKILSYGEITMVVLVTTLTYASNGVVFNKIRSAQRTTSLDAVHEQRKNARERKIFIQFFITTIWLLVFDIPFIAIGYIDSPSYWMGYFVTIAYTINCSINGWVYVFLNKTVQIELKDMCFKNRRVSPAVEDSEYKDASQRRKTLHKIEAFRLKRSASVVYQEHEVTNPGEVEPQQDKGDQRGELKG